LSHDDNVADGECVQMTFQNFIDDLFLSILTVDAKVPPAIKYLFDFLDNAADRRGLSDVVHTWKTNRYLDACRQVRAMWW